MLGLAIGESAVSAVAVLRGRPVWAAEASYGGVADLGDALAGLAAARPRGTRRTAVALGAASATVKTVEGLPPLPADDLAAHVRLRSRRYFLQNGVPLVTAAAPLLERGKPTSRALLASAEAPFIEAVAAGVAAAGLECGTIVPSALLAEPDEGFFPGAAGLRLAFAAATAAPPRLSLTTDAARASEERHRRAATMRLAVAAAACLALAGAAWLGSRTWQLRRDARLLERLRPATASALAVRADLDAATAALALVARQEAASSRHARLLADLANSLPDSAFVTTLQLTAGGGSLAGYAAHAGAVARALERSGRFAGVRLEGAVTREPLGGTEWERFTLRFAWRP